MPPDQKVNKAEEPIYLSTNIAATMDKLMLTGQNLGRVFKSRLGHACIGHATVHITKRQTRPKQLLGYLPLAFMLPAATLFHPSLTFVGKSGGNGPPPEENKIGQRPQHIGRTLPSPSQG